MVFWIILMLAGITELYAFPKTLSPGACTTKPLPTLLDKNTNQEFLKSVDGVNGGWAYKYSSVKDSNEGLISASLHISKIPDPNDDQEASYNLITQYQIKSYKINPAIEDIVTEQDNKLVTKLTVKGQGNKPETEYVILKAKPHAYVYFYKCSNDPAAETGRDARFVLVWNGELSEKDKIEIEDFDSSLSEGDHKVFTGKIQEI